MGRLREEGARSGGYSTEMGERWELILWKSVSRGHQGLASGFVLLHHWMIWGI